MTRDDKTMVWLETFTTDSLERYSDKLLVGSSILSPLADLTDVAEELDRLESHVKELQDALQRNEPVGRRLDFLMQEFNREANTLGSKSQDVETTRASVDLKVLIEQMREQIQNIE